MTEEQPTERKLTEEELAREDEESIRRRKELDEIVNEHQPTDEYQKLQYKRWLSQQQFINPCDVEVFNKLPLSDRQKMDMIAEMLRDGEIPARVNPRAPIDSATPRK